jgi:hypothetical protein
MEIFRQFVPGGFVAPYGVLVLFSVAFPLLSATRTGGRASVLLVNLFLAALVGLLVISILKLPWTEQWIATVALTPSMLVIHQMFFLWLNRPRRSKSTASPKADEEAIKSLSETVGHE